jgi:hypothetical protein
MENNRNKETECLQKLELLCKQYNRSFSLISRISYWTAEVYSFGKHLRKYGFYPKWLPLCVYTDHAPGAYGEPFEHELESTAPAQLYHSPYRVEKWRSVSEKPCYCYYSPFVYFRKTNHINKSDDASGTIAFPSHGTVTLEDTSNIQDYINHLKGLPDQFQPVGVCLHMNEILKGSHIEYIEAGFDVFTAGHNFDDSFAERFYSIIKKFRYATSNIVGSYAYYCVEMEIPFFLSGEPPKYVNKGDHNIPLGNYDPYKEYELYRKAYDLFSGVTTSISIEQKNFVTTSLGLHSGISRLQMAKVLYSSFFRCVLNRDWMVSLFERYKNSKSVHS